MRYNTNTRASTHVDFLLFDGWTVLDSKARGPLQDLWRKVGRLAKNIFPVTQTSFLHGAVELQNQLLQQLCRSLALAPLL